MKQLLSLATMLGAATFLYAQTNSNYTGLKSSGQVPDDFTKATLEKIAETEITALETLKKKERQEFVTQVNFGIDNILQSGRVCFNDTISNYVSSVLEEIKSYNHQIPSQVRIYTVKSPVVNAYTTDQGIVFINTGLLAQLENEAQLAFVLCHEIVHYMKKHVRMGYVEDTKIANNQADYRTVKSIDKDLASSRFSRKLEKEADKIGLEMFLNTPYNPHEIDGVFDVLLYAYLPFDEIVFDSNFLEFGDYTIPSKYKLKEVAAIEVDEEEDDAKHTHPNIAKRRAVAERLIAGTSPGKNFILPKEEFYAVRAAARYEVLRLQIINGNYSEALYSAYLLEKEYPNNDLSKKAIGEILYGTAIYANNKNRKKVVGYYRKQQGEVQQVYFQLGKIKSKDLNLIAAKYSFDLANAFPENNTIQKRTQFLFTELVYRHDITYDDLILSSDDLASPLDSSNNVASAKSQSKYDRIKASKAKKKAASMDLDWALAVFKNCQCEAQLDTYFETAIEQSDSIKLARAETDDVVKNSKILDAQRKARKKLDKRGYALGIDKIVLVDPYYAVLKNYGPSSYKQVKSAKELTEFLQHIPQIADRANLEVDVLTPYAFEANSTEQFNDFSLLNEWATERFEMENQGNFVSLSEEVKELVKRHNTRYFGFTGIVNRTNERDNKFWVALLSIYTIVWIPWGLYYCVTPEVETSIYFALFDVETGKVVMYQDREIPLTDYNGLLKSHYYDIFTQIKK